MPKASTINEVSTGTLLPPISEGEAEGQVYIGRQQWGRDKTAILKKAIFLHLEGAIFLPAFILLLGWVSRKSGVPVEK